MMLVLSAAMTSTAHAAPPANDDLADATQIVGAQFATTGTNAEATREADEPDHADIGPGDSHSVWFAWTAPTSGTAIVSTCESAIYAALAVYTGNAFADPLARVGKNATEFAS